MPLIKLMKEILFEAIIILMVALLLSLIHNAVSPTGVKLLKGKQAVTAEDKQLRGNTFDVGNGPVL